jgi:hypothetical protein
MQIPTNQTATNNVVKYFETLGPALTIEHLTASFEALVEHQNEQIERGEALSPIPLVWLALAEWVGLTVDLHSGRITHGPSAKVRGFL